MLVAMHLRTLTSIYDGLRATVLGALLLVLLTLGGSQLSSTPTQAAFTAAPIEHAAPQSQCWVTGDLVGDANPAEIDASFCRSSY